MDNIRERTLGILQQRGYAPVGTDIASQSFSVSVIENSPECRSLNGNSVNAGRILDEAEGKLHLVSIVRIGEAVPFNADNFWIVGMHATMGDIAGEELQPLPTALRLVDFLERIGDQDIAAFFDALPRGTKASYAAIKPVEPTA